MGGKDTLIIGAEWHWLQQLSLLGGEEKVIWEQQERRTSSILRDCANLVVSSFILSIKCGGKPSNT